MEQAAVDTMPSLFWGYTIFWGVIAAYCLALGRRISKLEK